MSPEVKEDIVGFTMFCLCVIMMLLLMGGTAVTTAAEYANCICP